ncbi:MAG: tetraacyldisaccharide 4'-kinase, partial [Deltaproteobacteria bacterium]|nr:tetraacyldisaccharide 4'-kinase [Deltaproteobacteria bacterium]
MNVRKVGEKLLNSKSPGPLIRLALVPLTGLSLLYAWIMTARALLYRIGALRSHTLPCSVITVGNLTVGGTGKTPTVVRLAKRLQQQGYRVAVVNRGYRGSMTATAQVVSNGEACCAAAKEVGDEACMLAEKLPGIPVVAGRHRVAACRKARELCNAQLILLDDGFQHLRLARDCDIVLINAANPFGNGYLLPRGILREPLTALKRASCILLTKTDTPGINTLTLKDRIKHYAPGAPIFTAAVKPASLRSLATGAPIAGDDLSGQPVAGLCSIGDPENFFSMLQHLGAAPITRLAYPDHHQYQQQDYETIQARSQKCSYILTTDKDITKIDQTMINKDKYIVVEIEQNIDEEDTL